MKGRPIQRLIGSAARLLVVGALGHAEADTWSPTASISLRQSTDTTTSAGYGINGHVAVPEIRKF